MYKRFFRRFLPFILSVAMTVEMIPATAFASEVVPETEKETEIRVVDPGPDDIPFITSVYSDDENAGNAFSDAVKGCVSGVFFDDGEVAGEAADEILFTYGWRKAKTDDEWEALYPVTDENKGSWEETAVPDVPENVGKYICEVSVSAVENVCGAASVQIPCEIVKNKLTVDYDGTDGVTDADKIRVLPGTKVSDFIDSVKKHVIVCREGSTTDAKGELLASFDVSVKKRADRQYVAVTADELFQSGVDYFYTISLTLKETCAANYELSGQDADGYAFTDRNVNLGDYAATKIVVTDKNGADLVVDPLEPSDQQPFLEGKIYDANYISIEKDILPLINLKVQYDADPTPETPAKWTDLGDESAKIQNLTLEWWDSGCNQPLDEMPLDAGSYALRISYAGKEGVYKPSGDTFIRVRIKADKIYIKPQAVNAMFYSGTAVQDVVSKISYQVFLKKDNSRLDIDPETFWGVAYNEKSFKQAYAPVFKLLYAEKDENTGDLKQSDGKIIYQSCDPLDVLESGKKYIAVFSGYKATYDNYGSDPVDKLHINEKSVNSACVNYDVLVDDETLLDNFVDINLTKAIKTEVDVTSILRDGKGSSFGDPIIYHYDRGMLYEERTEYKKAVVRSLDVVAAGVVAKDASSMIHYQWQRLSGVMIDKDGDPDPQYEYLSDGDPNNKKSPYMVGSYRLEISFIDETHVLDGSVGYVYYEIQPNFVMLDTEDEYSVYTRTTAGDFINRHRDEIKYGFREVSGNVYKPEIIKGVALKFPEDSYEITWSVERSVKNPDGSDSGEYEKMDDGDEFDEDHQYRMMASVQFSEEKYADHRADYSVLPGKVYCFNAPVKINVLPMGDIPVEFVINADKFSMDPAQPGKTYKVYDGEDVTVSNIEELVTVKSVSDGREIKDFPKEQIEIRWSVTYDDGKTVSVSAPRDAGSYTMSVYFPGNGTYRRTEPDEAADANLHTAVNICRIGRRDLTITPVQKGTVKAGSKFASADNFPLSLYRFDGVASSDAEAFSYRKNKCYDIGYKEDREAETIKAFVLSCEYGPNYASGLTTVEISDKGGAKTASQRYKSDVEYYAKTTLPKKPTTEDMAEPYCHNYNIINAKAAHTAARVGSQLYYDQVNSRQLHFRSETKDGVRRVIPSEGLPYRSSFKDVDGKVWPEGNYFSFGIKAPAEFDDPDALGVGYNNIFESRALLKNSIANAGGAITCLDGDSGEAVVAFPADGTGNAVFEVFWQNGFAETFEVVLERAILCSDTSKAVLPKSMKFSDVSKKMAVGEVQQLNLAITKKQLSDVIRIGYSVSDKTVLSVTSNGSLTALKKGKATVTAYPVRLVEDKEVPIPGGMIIKTTITVVDVAKPTITKVTALDNVITIHYKKPANGYRREFYVLEGKRTAAEFEQKISSFVNNDWKDVFDVSPIYGDGLKDEKTGTYVKVLGNSFCTLEYNKQYSVYVRNISGIRTLHDGGTVASSAAGVVKTIMTTKENVQDLDIVLNERFEVSQGADYEVPFFEDYVTATVYGLYHECHENKAAEAFDMIAKELPLSKEEQEIYVNPKLSYYVTDTREDYYEDEKLAKDNGYTVKIGTRYYYPTKLAVIDKKGKMTIKGLGSVRMRVYDSVKDIMSCKDVKITANVDAFDGKTGKAKVGQSLDLSTLLVYYENEVKVAGNPADFAAPKAVLPEGEAGWLVDDKGMFVAKRPGTYTVKIVDDIVRKNGGNAETTVTVQVSAMEPVKNLKSIFVYDAYAKIKFNYSSKTYYVGVRGDNGESSAEVDFRVDIRDAAGRLVYSQFLDGENYETDDENIREYHYLIDGLSRRSTYKVSVTAFYGEQESKAVSKTIKTTGVPVSYMDMDEVYEYITPDYDHEDDDRVWYRRTKAVNAGNGCYNGRYDIYGRAFDYQWYAPECLPDSEIENDAYQGVHIETWGLNEFEWELDDHPFFTSGSSYILCPREEDLGGFKEAHLYSKEAKSDSLVWKVEDPKIASVKALSGSFSAKLKAVKPGTTTLEVRSKNTKKVIARYKIKVKAVGDGHDYFGDYYNEVQWDPTYEKAVEVLCIGNPISVEQADNEYVWICYEAKEDGVHLFSKYGGNDPKDIRTSSQVRVGRSSSWNFQDLETGVYLYEGMKLYMKLEGAVHYLNVACLPTIGMTTDSLTVDNPLSSTFSYRAPEDGCYTFTSNVDFLDTGEDVYDFIVKVVNGVSSIPLKEGTDYRRDADADTNNVHVLMKQGETVRMRIRGTNETKKSYTITVKPRPYIALSSTEVSMKAGKDEDVWFKFTAPEDGGYVFRTSEVSAELTGAYYDALDKWREDHTDILTNDGNKTAPYRVEMRKGENAAFRLTAAAETVSAKVGITTENMWILKVDEPVENKPMDGKGAAAWVKFEVPETGKYSWNLSTRAVVGTDYNVFYRKNSINAEKYAYRDLPDEVLNEGEIIYITLESLTDAQKTFTLSVSKVAGTILTGNEDGIAEDKRDDVTDGQELWYIFTAPEYGIYGLRITKNSTDGRAITVSEYANVGDTNAITKTPALNVSGISVHRVLEEGETVVFKVSAGNIGNPNTKTSVSARVSRCKFVEPGENGAVSIEKDTYGHFVLYAPADGIYNVLVGSGEGNFDITEAYRTDAEGRLIAIAGLTKDTTRTGVPLKEGGAMYFILRQTGGDTDATGTITAVHVTDDESEENFDEDITLDANETKWFSYKVNRDGRYYISASGGCSIQWYDAYDEGIPHIPNPVTGDVLKAGKTIYIKVTKNEESGDICLTLERIEPGILRTGVEGTVIRTSKDDHTWYRFTSTETAFYKFDYKITNEEGSASCKYYESASSTGAYIKTVTDGSSHVIFMEKDDCMDFHFLDTTDSTDAVMTVSKVIADGSITADDKTLKSVSLSSDSREAWYHFEAPANGNYAFAVTGAAETEKISYFVSRADDPDSVKRSIYTPIALTASTMALQQGDKVLIRLETDAPEATVEVGVSTRKMWILKVDEPLEDKPLDSKDIVTWIKFVVPADGKYLWDLDVSKPDAAGLDTSAVEGTDYNVFYRKNSVSADKRAFESLPDETLIKNETVYITIESLTDDANKFSLSVSELDGRELTGGEEEPAEDERTDVTDGKELWYIFTAPSYGFYEFTVSETTGYRTIAVQEYDNVGDKIERPGIPPLDGNGNVVHRLLEKDEKVVFKITAGIDGSAPGAGAPSGMPSTVSVKVEKCRFESYDGKVFSLAGNAFAHYKLTATEPGAYDVAVMKTSGKGNLGLVGAYQENVSGKLDELTDLAVGRPVSNVLMRTGESLYFILRENSGNAAVSGRIIADRSAGGGGAVDGATTLKPNSSTEAEFLNENGKWYAFTASSLGFYEFRITRTDGPERTVTVTEHLKVDGPDIGTMMTDYGTVVHRRMNVGERIIFKIMTGTSADPTPTKVSIDVNICSFEDLRAGGPISVDANGYGHYMLTAPETGKYNVLIKKTEGSFEIMGAYREDLETDLGIQIGDILPAVSMRKDESLYFILEEDGIPNADAKGTITAEKNMGNGEKVEETVTMEANETRWFTYHVDQIGRYYITASASSADGCSVSWYKADNMVDPIPQSDVGNIFNVNDTIYIKVTKNNVEEPVRLTVERVSPISLQTGVPYTDISMDQAAHSWYNFTADADGGYYLFEYNTTKTGGSAYKFYNTVTAAASAGEESGIALTSGSKRIIYMAGKKSVDLHFYDDGITGNKASITIRKISDTNIDPDDPKPVQLTLANGEQWYHFTAPTNATYKLERADATGTMDVTYFKRIASTDPTEPAIYDLTAGTQVSLDSGKDVFVRLSLGAGASASANALMLKGDLKKLDVDTSVTHPIGSQSTVTWIRFEAPDTGMYDFNLTGSAGAVYGTHYTAAFRKQTVKGEENNNFGEIPKLLQKGDVIYITVISKTDSANTFSLSVSRNDKALELTGTPPSYRGDISMADGEEQWYSFTALAYGFYEFSISPSDGTIALEEYDEVGAPSPSSSTPDPALKTNGEIVHRLLEEGEKVVFKVKAMSGSPTVTVKILQCVFDEHGTPGVGGSVSVVAGQYEHYKLTAKTDGLYNVLVQSDDVDFHIVKVCRDDSSTRLSKWTDRTGDFTMNKVRFAEALAGGESLYFIVKNNNASSDISGSISMYPVKNLGGGGSAQESLTLEQNEVKWYSYRAQWNDRYYISASDGCSVELYEKDGDQLIEFKRPSPENAGIKVKNNTVTGNILHKNDVIYIKVSNDGGSTKHPVLTIDRALLGSLQDDAADTYIETKKGDHSWYQFTAPEEGYYLFEYKKSSGDADTTCKYYKPVTGTSDDGTYIDEIKSDEGRVISMTEDQTFDFHFYTTGTETAKGNMKISLINMHLKTPGNTNYVVDGANKTERVYTATGLSSADQFYNFKIGKSDGEAFKCLTSVGDIDVEYYVKRVDSSGPYVYVKRADPSDPAPETLDGEGYLNLDFVTKDTNYDVLVRLGKAADNEVKISVIGNKIYTLTPDGTPFERTNSVDDQSKPTYIRLADGVAPSGLYYVESTKTSLSGYGCKMSDFLDSGAAVGDSNSEISMKVNADSDFGKVYRITGTACNLSLLKAYDLSSGASVDVDIAAGKSVYLTYKASHYRIYYFTREKKANNLKCMHVVWNNSRRADAEMSIINDETQTAHLTLEADELCILKITNDNASPKRETFKVIEESIVALDKHKADSWNVDPSEPGYGRGDSWNIPKGMTRYFEYTASDTKDYKFECSGDALEFSLYTENPLENAEAEAVIGNDDLKKVLGDVGKSAVSIVVNKSIYIRVENKGSSAVWSQILVDRYDIDPVQKVTVTELGNFEYTKEIGKQYMVFSFTPEADGFYDFELTEVPDGESERVAFYPNPKHKSLALDLNHRPDAVNKPLLAQFVPKDKRIEITNDACFSVDSGKEKVKLKITKNTVRLPKELDPLGGKSPNRTEWYNDNPDPNTLPTYSKYDIFTYDVPVYGKGKFCKITLYEWAPATATYSATKHKVKGVLVRKVEGDTLRASSGWDSNVDPDPENPCTGSPVFLMPDEKKLIIAVFALSTDEIPKDYYVKIEYANAENDLADPPPATQIP